MWTWKNKIFDTQLMLDCSRKSATVILLPPEPLLLRHYSHQRNVILFIIVTCLCVCVWERERLTLAKNNISRIKARWGDVHCLMPCVCVSGSSSACVFLVRNPVMNLIELSSAMTIWNRYRHAIQHRPERAEQLTLNVEAADWANSSPNPTVTLTLNPTLTHFWVVGLSLIGDA